MKPINNLTVLIGGYDPYESVWHNFFKLYKKYWHISCKSIFATNQTIRDVENIQFVATGTDIWSNKIIKAIDQIDTKYTFFILDDYFLTEPLTFEEIKLHIDFLEEYNANKIMLDYFCRHLTLIDPIQYTNRIIYKLSTNSDYLTSVQPSIWKTDYLRQCLHTNWNAWQFEIEGTKKLKGTDSKTYLMVRDTKPYWNAVVKGKKVTTGWDMIKNNENLEDFNI
jgi:hypothetical protein